MNNQQKNESQTHSAWLDVGDSSLKDQEEEVFALEHVEVLLSFDDR